MKNAAPLIFLISMAFMSQTVHADVSLEFKPSPLYGQLWAFETYELNISMPEVDVSKYAEHELTGNLVYNGSIHWKGVGTYHHGTGSTGYSYILDVAYFQKVEEISLGGSAINITLSKDAYRFGMKPFEEVEITFRVEVFLEIIEDGEVILGPEVDAKTRKLVLVDEDKVEYLEDKFIEMQDDVNPVLNAPGLERLNLTKYEGFIESMNQSLIIGDYTDSLNQWQKWDNKERLRMFSALIREVGVEHEELVRLRKTETELEVLQADYNHLEDKYVAIFKELQLNLTELDVTKQGLSTAITGVFLSAIVFFFLGRRTVNGVED